MSTLKPITCPSCGAGKFEHDAGNNLVCASCGTRFDSPRELVICSACGTENPPSAMRCMNCGLTLGRVCAVCNHLNPPGTENCLNCASPLDAITSITSRMGQGKRRSDALREQILVSQKSQDMQFMAEQRARIDAEESVRLASIASQQQKAAQEQRVLIVIVVTVLLIIAVATVGFILLAGW
jgi:ribosomal protein L40E